MPNSYFAYGQRLKRMFVIFNKAEFCYNQVLLLSKYFPDLLPETNLILTDFKVTNTNYNIRNKFANEKSV